jgi:signal transduction histidine kinase
MKRISASSARNALILFIALAVVFYTQMVWWIIFQVRNTDNTKAFFTEAIENERRWAIQLMNSHYLALHDAAVRTLNDTSIMHAKGGYCDPAVSGLMELPLADNPNMADSLYFIISAANKRFALFLNHEYPKMILAGNKHLEFIPPKGGELKAPEWLSQSTIRIKSEAYSRIDNEGRKHLKMFLMEGSFFLLLISIGVYMIYSALKRTKEIREEQLLFVHSITHELKIPITSLNLFIDTLKRRRFEEKLVSELAPKMKEDLVRLNHLIDNILQVRRLSDKAIDSRPAMIDLSVELGKFAERIKERIESSGGRLRLSLEKNIRIFADLSELARVWESLVDNSLKYGKSGTVEIEIRLLSSKGQAEIEFIDNGQGIPGGMEDRLFEPFYRGNIENRKTVPGSGLGLYIAREFVRRNKGEISIKNVDGGGCMVIQRYKIRK